MKKSKLLLTIIFTLFVCLLACCDSYTPPISKQLEQNQKINLFNNYKFNSIGLQPQEIILNNDFSGQLTYAMLGEVADVKNSIINTIDEINKNAYNDGDYQAGYRAIYIQDKNITQKDQNVYAVIEFSNINYLNCELEIKTLQEYVDNNDADSEENNNYIDLKNKQRSSIIGIENKQDYYIAICDNFSNQAPVTINGYNIIAYYTENIDSTFIDANKNYIKCSNTDYKFIFTKVIMPSWLIITSSIICALFLTVLIYKIIKIKKA